MTSTSHLLDYPHPEYILDLKVLQANLAELEGIRRPDLAVFKMISGYKQQITRVQSIAKDSSPAQPV